MSSYQVSAIGDMIRCLEKKDFAVLAAERSYRLRYIGETLSGLPFSQENGLALNNVETERLIDLYLREGLLGASEAVRSRTKFVHEISRDPIAVACCRILNDFRPLDRIVDTIVKATSADEQKRYFTAALAQHCFRGGVRYDVLASIGGRAGWNEQFEPGHPMPLAYFEGSYRNFVVPLNGTLATRILQRAKQEASETLLGVFVDLANAIAPRVNRGAIRRRSPEARLAGRLFDYDQVTSNFLGDSSATLYAETQPAWQWNSRYWEQVALLHLARYHASPSTVEGKEALVHAVQHARHAVSIEHHPLPLTTLGKILLAQLGQEGLSLTATFEEAFARLTDAIALERSWTRMSIHPFISLFRGTREYIDCGGILTGSESDELRRLTREASTKFRRDQEMEEVIAQIVPVLQ